MKTKLVDFDLEKAKAGAKVVTRDGRNVRILCYDVKGEKKLPIIALVDCGEFEYTAAFYINGRYYGKKSSNLDLLIEEQVEELPKEHIFQPFEKVLVRDLSNECWKINLFSHLIDDTDYPYQCFNQMWKQCIPYEGNESLLGTTETPKL